MVVVRALQAKLRRYFVQHSGPNVTAKMRRAGTEFVSAHATIDERSEFIWQSNKVCFRVDGELVNVEVTDRRQLAAEVVITEDAFGRKMRIDHVLQAGVETEAGVEEVRECSVRNSRAEIQKERQ